MDLVVPCNSCTSLYRQAPLHPRLSSPKHGTFSFRCPRKITSELQSPGYALLCVGFTSSDVEVETQDEDEVYWLQFGRYFARGPIERDDYALELALGDE